MEKENIEKIMEEYKSGLIKIEGKDKENNIEINKMNLHIQRLKDEREEVKFEKTLYDEYTKKIEETEKELKDLNKSETPEIKKQKEVDKMNLKDIAIRDLTQANMKIDKAIDEAQLEHLNTMNEIGKFELKYNANGMPLNGNERRELFDKSHKIIDKISELKEAKVKCEEYLVELKQPTKEIETINSILNETYGSNLREATEDDLEVEDKNDKLDKKEDITSVKSENPEVKKLNLDDIDFNLPEELNEEEIIENKKEENVNEINKNKQEDIKTIYINGKKSELYINQDKKNPIKIDYSDEKDLIINKIVNDTFNVVPKEMKKIEESLKKSNISKESMEQLLKTYKEQKKQVKTEGKKLEFQYADPNIVVALKNNPEKLQEYADFLNGKKKIDKENKMSFNIKYDIRGLSKSEMSDEEKQQIEDYAFIHRNIAKIKKNPLQAIKFAFRGLLEKFRKVKALPAGNLIKEEYTMSDEGKESFDKAYEQSKAFKESLKVEEKEEKTNINIDEKMNRYEELAKKINDSFDKDIEK